MAERIYAKSITMTYSAGVPITRKSSEDFKVEDNLTELGILIKMKYDVDTTTAPTSPTTFPSQDRLLGIIDNLRLNVKGNFFFEIQGRNIRPLVSLFYEEDEYEIEELSTTVNQSDLINYAHVNLPIQRPRGDGVIGFEIQWHDDNVLSANDKYNVDSVEIRFLPVYGKFSGALKIVNSDKTVSGLTDIDLSKELGKLLAVISNGYNTTINISDIELKDKKIHVIRRDYYEYMGRNRQVSHGAITKTLYPNVVMIFCDELIDVDDSTKYTLKTSTSQSFNITQVFLEKVSSEIVGVPTQKPTRTEDISKPVEATKETRESPRKSKTFLGWRI